MNKTKEIEDKYDMKKVLDVEKDKESVMIIITSEKFKEAFYPSSPSVVTIPKRLIREDGYGENFTVTRNGEELERNSIQISSPVGIAVFGEETPAEDERKLVEIFITDRVKEGDTLTVYYKKEKGEKDSPPQSYKKEGKSKPISR